jgi:flagellar hook-associated protein 1
MGNLLASLISSAQTLKVYERSLNVIQNNVGNAQTPGWAAQTQTMSAKRFEPALGIIGGVQAGELSSSRNEFLERGVRDQATASGYSSKRAEDLSQVESVVGIGAGSISDAISGFFSSVTAWSVNPNDTASRQTVLDKAGSLARTFTSASNGLAQAESNSETDVHDTVDAINTIAAKLARLNQLRQQNIDAAKDPGLEASLYSTLEDLSQYVNYSAIPQADGSVSVFVGGQAPLVIGAHTYNLDAVSTGNQLQILDGTGDDITSQIGGGQLKASLDTRNTEIPKLRDSLGTLAQTMADQINATLNQGLDAGGGIPAMGLFQYTGNNPAGTLALTGLTAQQLAGASAASPGGNDNILELAKLGSTPQVQGQTYAQFYGAISASVGGGLAAANDQKQIDSDLLTQARSLRSDTSGVSLDEEATKLIELQRGYEANAKLVQTLNSLTETLLGILR